MKLNESVPQNDTLLSPHEKHGKEEEGENKKERRGDDQTNEEEDSVLLPFKLNKQIVGKLKELILSRFPFLIVFDSNFFHF